MKNETVDLGIFNGNHQSNEFFSIHTIEARDSMRPFVIRSIPKSGWIVCGIAWLFIFIGSYFRYILYSHIFHKFKQKKLTPIDVLILLASVIQHVTNLAKIGFYTAIVYEGASAFGIGVFAQHWDWKMGDVGQWFCFFIQLSIQFEMNYSCIGSLGISIFRILYITQESFVKYKIGEKTLLIIILLGGLIDSYFDINGLYE